MTDLILKLYRQLGYPNSDLQTGFALRWLEASLLGEEDEAQFEARLHSIINTPIEDWANDIKNAKYSPRLVDLISFFDSLTIYQNPSHHSNLFAQDVQAELYDYSIISPLASSEAIIKQGGLVAPYSECFISSVQEITDYFDYLGKLLDKVENDVPSHQPTPFLLINKHQAAAIVYKPTKGWSYRTIQHHFSQKSSADIAARIMIDFCTNNASKSYAEFNINLILSSHDKRVDILTEQLKPRDQTTEKNWIHTTDDKEDVLDSAMIVEDALLKNLIVLQARDLNANLLGNAPILLAARDRFCEASKVDLLIKHGVNLNLTDLEGNSPLFWAASNGNEEIVALLAASGADPSQMNHQQISPMMIAILNGHANVVAVLAAYDAPIKNLYMPILYAILKGDTKVITALANKIELNLAAYIQHEKCKELIDGKELAVQNRLNDFFNDTPDNNSKLLSLYDFATIIGNDDITHLLRTTATALFALHKKLGDNIFSEGVCHGFSVRWLEACFLGEQEEARFEARLQKIGSISAEDLLTQITEAQNQQHFSPELLDLLGFFESLALFQYPDKSIFSKKINQHDYEDVSAVASSDEIQKQGGLINIYSDCFIATSQEITDYLNALTEILNNIETSDIPIGFTLGSKDHSIPLTYQTDRGWFCRDIGQKPVRSKNTAIIAEHIIKGFSINYNKTPPYVAFSIKLIITRQDKRVPALKQKLQTFKDSHVITQEMALRQYNKESLIYIAAAHSHINLVQHLLDHHPTANNLSLIPSLIYLAVLRGDVALLKILARPGVSLDQQNSDGYSLLHLATNHNDEEMVETLTGLGAALNLLNENDMSALMLANSENIVKILINNGVNVNLVNNAGCSALYFAILANKENIVKLLIDNNADVNLIYNGTPLLMLATQLENENIVQMVVEKMIDKDPLDKHGLTPLVWAIMNHDGNIARVLINNKADINKKLDNGLTPMLYAITNGNAKALELLIDHGAALNVPMDVIFFAVMLGYTDVIKILASIITFPKDIVLQTSHLKMINSDEIEIQKRISYFLKDIRDDEEISLTFYDTAKKMGYSEMADCIAANAPSEKNNNKISGDEESQSITGIPNLGHRKLNLFSDSSHKNHALHDDNHQNNALQKGTGL